MTAPPSNAPTARLTRRNRMRSSRSLSIPRVSTPTREIRLMRRTLPSAYTHTIRIANIAEWAWWKIPMHYDRWLPVSINREEDSSFRVRRGIIHLDVSARNRPEPSLHQPSFKRTEVIQEEDALDVIIFVLDDSCEII